LAPRWSPSPAADPPEGLVTDATGAAHLNADDATVLGDMVSRLVAAGLKARAAIADSRALSPGRASIHLPGDVSDGRQAYSDREPFGVKAWPRISASLTEPICAVGLNGAREKDDSEPRDEQDHPFHWTGT